MRTFTAWLRLLRPAHWIKNVFVLAGVFFSGDWRDWGMVFQALIAFAVFCLAASAAYCANDAIDREADRNHPRKKSRPLAVGHISREVAFSTAGLLGLISLALAFWMGPALLFCVAGYLIVNAFYSTLGKHRVLVDVFCISAGFIARLLAGTWGIGIEPSQWILLCTLALSLFLGFSKRYAELMDDDRPLAEKRQVLKNYSPDFLRLLMGVTLSASLITYGLYTTSPRTLEAHRTGDLIYTLPIAMFGLFRYLYLVMERGLGENTVADILKDKQMLVVCVAYPAAVLAILAL